MSTSTRQADSRVDVAHPSGDTTLVVVDMQPKFMASKFPRILAAVQLQIKKAIAAGWSVVVLEFENHGATHLSLMNHLVGQYDRHQVASKNEDDGAEVVLEVCHAHRFGDNKFRVCGVNTNACVEATVLGLLDRQPQCQVELAIEACANDFGMNQIYPFRVDRVSAVFGDGTVCRLKRDSVPH